MLPFINATLFGLFSLFVISLMKIYNWWNKNGKYSSEETAR